MRVITGILLASLACALLVAAGCTGSSHTTAASSTPAAPAAVSAPADPWPGIWDTKGSTPEASQTTGVLTLTRDGSSVTGTYSNGDLGRGTLSGTVSGNQLTGTWKTDYGSVESVTGSFVLVLSDDRKSFSGTWVDGSDTANTLSTSQEFWDGVKRSS